LILFLSVEYRRQMPVGVGELDVLLNGLVELGLRGGEVVGVERLHRLVEGLLPGDLRPGAPLRAHSGGSPQNSHGERDGDGECSNAVTRAKTMVMPSLRARSPKNCPAAVTTLSRMATGSSSAARRMAARNRFSPYSSPRSFSHSTMPS